MRLFYFLAGLILLAPSCQPSYDVSIPENIELGENVFYIDGESRNFDNIFKLQKLNSGNFRLRLLFEEIINDGDFINHLTCVLTEPQTNLEYTPTNEENNTSNELFVAFDQGYEEDQLGYEYKYVCSKDEHFKIFQYDTILHTVAGEGQLKFKRISKNGAPSGSNLDKIIYIHFAFHDYYEL